MIFLLRVEQPTIAGASRSYAPSRLNLASIRKGGRPTAAMRVRSRTCGKVRRDEIEEELIEIEGATPMCDDRGVPPFRRQRRKSRRVFTADPSVPMWTNVPMCEPRWQPKPK